MRVPFIIAALLGLAAPLAQAEERRHSNEPGNRGAVFGWDEQGYFLAGLSCQTAGDEGETQAPGVVRLEEGADRLLTGTIELVRERGLRRPAVARRASVCATSMRRRPSRSP